MLTLIVADDLATGTTIDILGLTGHRIFATEVDGLERLEEKTFIDSRDMYIFGEEKRKEYEVLSDPNPIKNDRRSAVMHQLYPTSIKNYLNAKKDKKSDSINHDKEAVKENNEYVEENQGNPGKKHENKIIEHRQTHGDHKNQEELKTIIRDIKKGGYREADAKGKFSAIQARSKPAKSPSRDDLYNKHLEKHKNAFGDDEFIFPITIELSYLGVKTNL